MTRTVPTSVPLRLLTGPAGAGKTHAALELIREAATTPGARGRGAAHPDEALLVLPTYAQVNHVKRRALSRWNVRGLFDRPFTTFTAAGERFLDGFRVRALPSPEERDRLMEEALRQRDEPLFRAIADRPGFRAHLLCLVKELKQTGLEGGEAREHLAAGRGEVGAASRVRLDAFLAVFECYEDLLERAGLEDHEDALRRLARRLHDDPPTVPPRVLVVDGFDDFSRVEEEILHPLAASVVGAGGAVLVTLPWDETRPHVFAASHAARRGLLARGFVEERLTGFARAASADAGGTEPLQRIATRLFAAASGVGPAAPLAGGVAVQTILAGDAEDEAESVARAVRALAASDAVRGWRDVGVVVRRLEEHAPRLVGAFARLGVPLRVVGRGDALASEPLVRALRGPLAVLAGDTETGRFDAGGLMEWLRWRALLGGDETPVSEVDRWDMRHRERGFPPDLATLCSQAPPSLAPACRQLADRAADLAGVAGAQAIYDGLARAIRDLAPLPEPSGLDAQGRPRDREHDRRLARGTAGRARAIDILASLRRAAQRTGLGGATRVADAVTELLDALEQTTLRPADRRLDAVTLMDAEEARFWELPVVVVAGLEEGGFPLRPREDVLLRDADRAALRAKDDALRLPLAREREARERRLFYGAVTRASRRLLLARRAYDDKGDAKEPSSFLRELTAVVEPGIAAAARTPGRVARPKEECFTPADWRLFAAGRLGPWAARRQDVPAAERVLAAALQDVSGTPVPRRALRLRRRASDALWYDDAGKADILAHFARATKEVSVSRLNHGVLCPFRFFLAYVAAVPQDDLTLDGPVFDARQKGSALHHAFELALRHPDWSPARLAQAGVDEVGAHGLEARLLEAELVRAVELLRDRERKTAGPLVPWVEGLELAFRKGRAVEIGPVDCRFRLGGFIDRIDRDGASPREHATILDYKRGTSTVESAFKACNEERDLQLPLYALALEAMEGVRVVGFEWAAGLARHRRVIHDAAAASLFAARREAKPLLEESSEEFRGRIDRAEAVAAGVVRRARAGDHARAPVEAGTCKGCYYRGVCRPDVAWLEARLVRTADARPEGDA